MALKKEITDNRGVKTRYHSIVSFVCNKKVIVLRVYSYVNQVMRDSEKAVDTQNQKALEYDEATDALRAELDSQSAKLVAGDESVRKRIVELTDEVNERTLNPDRPQQANYEAKHYSEMEIVIDYFEPITMEGLYDKLAETTQYGGSEKV